MDGIVWLASYPKSGNTWFRAFISNLLNEESEEVSINKMKTDGIFSSRQICDAVTGIETSNLTADEIDRLRPAIYNYMSQTSERELFIKVHDAYTYLENGAPLLGTTNAKAVYIMRNPLDVAVSFANHTSTDLDKIIRSMGDERFAFCTTKNSLPEQLRQKLLTWSSHVESWVQAAEIPVHVIRYEDLKIDPIKTFNGAVQFIGLERSGEQIRKAIGLSDFDKLKAEEDQNGFKERPYKTASFFRAGKVGDWRNYLSEEQKNQIVSDHKMVMKKYGYLDSQGNPVY
ncbi:MAG: sulfotransferase domain-containing protein [Candidatus Ozemobacteraceae bacterium]